MDDRVVYYPPIDWCYGQNLSKIETLHIPSFDEIDINDAIEFFQIKKYFDSETRAKTWSDESYAEYKSKAEKLSSLTKRFFNQLNNDSIIDSYDRVETEYRDDFWTLFDNCKLYNKISSDVFRSLINEKKVSPRDLFFHKNIVREYGNVLKEYILRNKHCITILLHVYEQDYTSGEKWFLPTELSNDEICKYLEDYINGEQPNTNHLQEIINMNYPKPFIVSDETRLKAKRRYNQERERILQNGANISQAIRISFDPTQIQEKIYASNEQETSISYSTKWLLETLDYPSVLNNFIYIFEFVDFPQMRSSHVNRMSRSGALERMLFSKSSRVYLHNYAFDFSNMLASIQIEAYYEFLKRQNVFLEDVIKWFFTEYIQSEFGCAEVRAFMPSLSSTYAEKCSSILATLESVLRQYSMYVKKGEIDFELVGMSTTPIPFHAFESLVPDKYIYGIGETFNRLSFWLFSAQCLFSFVDRIHNTGKRYDTFIELLSNEIVYLTDYREGEHSAFVTMASYDLIDIASDGRMTIKDSTKIEILYDLFHNDVINRWHYPISAQGIFEEFIRKGILSTDSTLFSKPEIDYLNYLLNRAEYCNGLELRNRYMHGIQQVYIDEDEHKRNYFVLLRLFVLLAIKINDDFCLREQRKKN